MEQNIRYIVRDGKKVLQHKIKPGDIWVDVPVIKPAPREFWILESHGNKFVSTQRYITTNKPTPNESSGYEVIHVREVTK